MRVHRGLAMACSLLAAGCSRTQLADPKQAEKSGDGAPTSGLTGNAGETADQARRDPGGTSGTAADTPRRPGDARDEPEFAIDHFDPGSVYLAGTLEEGKCGRRAIAKVETPNSAVVGFDCRAYPGTIDPATGHALYLNGASEQLREFRCDNDCEYWSPDMTYPLDPESNDPLVSRDHCPGGARASAMLLAPDGARLYQCAGDTWYGDDEGLLAYTGKIDALGPNLTALVDGTLIDLKTADRIGGSIHVDSLSVIRATDSGFLVTTDVPENFKGTIELWEVTLDGVATRLGAYPPLPEDQFISGNFALDASGALYQICSVKQGATDTVVRRTIEGESREVYTEADGPIVKLDGDWLITGP